MKNFFIRSILIVLLTIFPLVVYPQLVINEVCSNNLSGIPDEENDYEDWIELYNAGTTPINLKGYRIADRLPVASFWNLPDVTLEPQSNILLYASGKNRSVLVHHWETAVREDDTWKYIVPTEEVPDNWRSLNFNELGWNSGVGIIGYGDEGLVTKVPTGTLSLFMRKKFTVADTSEVLKAILHIDYDDAFVAHLNGVEIARANIKNRNPSRWDQAESEREALVAKGGSYEKYTVQKELLRKALVNGENVLTVQCHNHVTSDKNNDMTVRAFLSFGMKGETSLFSPTPEWFNEPLQVFHTNFKLSNTGSELLYLFDPASKVIDQILIPQLRENNAYGRFPDGSVSFNIFDHPTPGNANTAGYSGYCNDSIIFSQQAGFYATPQVLTLSGSSEIRYTLDGSTPTKNSTLYTTPLSLTRTTVVKAACYSATLLAPKIYTQTYFINEPVTLPVFSISTDPDNFFHPETGIYVLGPGADSTTSPNFGANFWFDWERPVHIEYFDKQKNKCFEVDAGARIFGNYSRANAMKSLAIMMRNRYDYPEINYQFFPYKNINKFKSIVLRNSGSDFNTNHLLDGFVHMSVMGKTALDIQGYRPAVVFINGEYWGIHNIREKLNEDYVEANSGVPADSVDMLDAWAKEIEGSNNLYDLWWRSGNSDMTKQANFNAIADHFDLDNMIDFFATQIYISNWDWPTNNIKAWRPQTGNKKYRYILHDTDISLGLFGLQNAAFNQLHKVKNGRDLSMGPHAELFFNLTKNIAFRNRFINRSADLMNTIFTQQSLSNLLSALRDSIAEEMPRHLARWDGYLGYWNYEIQNRMDFIRDRPVPARAQMVSEFNLVKQVEVTLNVVPAEAGVIKINTIYPDTYPWKGIYFDGVPVTVTAVPNPGYTFTHWEAPALLPSGSTDKALTLNVHLNETFTAYFSGAPVEVLLKVSEINYHSADEKDSGDWFELFNNGTSEVDLSNWTFKDFNDYNRYVFPENTVLPPKGRLVVCNDPVKFRQIYPSVSNYIGPFNFDLSNSGDMIRLYDHLGNCYISFSYDDDAPWDKMADGKGYTLELIDPSLDEHLPESWTTYCKYGSPGHPYNYCDANSIMPEVGEDLLSLYPNPNDGRFFLEVKNADYSLQGYKVINQLGEVVATNTNLSLSVSMSLELSDLPDGVYYLMIVTDKGALSKKVVKMRRD
jgi:hypothetical protein